MRLEVKWMRFAARVSSAAMVKVMVIMGSIWAGKWADETLGTYPLLLLLLPTLSFIAGVYYLMWVIQKSKPR